MNCPLCEDLTCQQLEKKNVPALFEEISYFLCPACGKYGISSNALSDQDCIPKLDGTQCAILSAFVCERHLTGKKVVILGPKGDAKTPNVRDEVWVSFDRILKEFPLPPITERFDRALLNLSKKCRPGKDINLSRTSTGILYAEDTPTAIFIIGALIERGDLKGDGSLPSNYRITPHGWVRVEELNRGHLAKENRQVFVAMWFDPQMEALYSAGIAPAVREAGFSPMRIDQKESNNQITDEIVAEIRRSKFMVADCTDHRRAVYYEAGLMHGLGRPVIFTCRQEDLEKACFDTNHYPHITWQTPEELRGKLLKRIQATIID